MAMVMRRNMSAFNQVSIREIVYAIHAATPNKFKSKIGELQFSLSRYEKLVRATIPIKNGEKIKFLLLLTFDIEAEAESIILKRILPCVAENKDYFLQ